MEKNKIKASVFTIFILLAFLLGINLSSSQALVSEVGVEYEFDIIEELDKNDWVKVIVEIAEEDEILLNSILLDLSNSEFRLEKKLLGGYAFFGEVTSTGLSKLLDNPKVTLVSLSRTGYPLLQESLPLMNADDVIGLGYTGKDQTVCVIDTGINYSHSDLGGCTEAEFLAGTCNKVLDGYDFYNSDSNPYDDNGHGTHVAGIVAANGGINGTAPDAKLIVMKACGDGSPGEGCPDLAIKESLTWCISNSTTYNISVITISIGDHQEYANVSDCPSTIKTEINNAYEAGIFVDVASGNNGHVNGISWPACLGNVTSVGAFINSTVV